jgi:hypothetical protein
MAYHCAACNIDLCYKCHRSRDLFDPGHDYDEVGPEFVAARAPSPDAQTVFPDGGATPFDITGWSSVSGDDVASDSASISSGASREDITTEV